MKEVNLWSPCVVRVKGERKYVQHYDNKSIEFSTVKGEALIFENSHSIEDFAKKAVLHGIHYVLEVPAKKIPNDTHNYILQIISGNCNGNYFVRYRGKYCYSSQFESAGKRMTKSEALYAMQLILLRYGYNSKIQQVAT
jgi:hypothetical protein